MKIDKNDVKAQARGQWKSILVSFGFTADQLNGKHQACPFCAGGVDRFRWIEKQERSWCNRCTQQSKDGLAMIMELNSFTFSQTIAELGDYLGLRGISNSERRNRAEARESAEIAIKQAELEGYYQSKEFEYHFYHVLQGEKYTIENINKLDLCQERIRAYELKCPSVKQTDRYINEVKFWNKIAMDIDTKFEMLTHYIASQLTTMQKAGKNKAEIGQAFNSIASKSKYGNETLKAKVIYLMKEPESIQGYSMKDLHIKSHADAICQLKTRQERIEMLADVPKQYQEGVAELVAIQFKLNKL